MFGSSLFRNQEKVNNFLLTYKHNPFPAPPASADFLEKPAKFIIGRDKELELIGSPTPDYVLLVEKAKQV